MKTLQKCCICGSNTEAVFQLKFKDIIGMSENYTQLIGLCHNCGFIYTQNPFSEEQLANRYKNYSKFEFDEENYMLDENASYKKRSLRQRQMIKRELHLGGDINSILEIGASSGYNLSLYSDDCEIYGIEPSRINCKNAKQNYGLDMFCGTYQEYRQNAVPKAYDLIFLSHVLEHIVEPSEFINWCSTINTKYLFIEVPTLDYKFVDEPFGMFCEEHVNIFTLESLQNLMIRNGYELVDCEMIMGLKESLPAGWPAVSTLWKKREKGRYFRTFLKSSEVFHQYIISSQKEMERVFNVIHSIPDNKKVAIWGTGHHASMLLANTDLPTKNIVAVYDSDKRKEGHIMNGISIQPFNPNDCAIKKIECILLATYTAQKALEKLLLPYNETIEVIKLYD